jgi:hypothetical protein
MVRFLTRLAAFVLLVLTVQALLIPVRPPELAFALDTIVSSPPATLFVGDSSVLWTKANDVDRRSIGRMFEEQAPGTHVLASAAYTAELWHLEVQELLRRGVRFRTLLAPVNLRSFSTSWDRHPTYQFAKEKAFLSLPEPLRGFYWPLLSLQAIKAVPISQRDYDSSPVFDGRLVVGTVRDFEDARPLLGPAKRLKRDFVYHYMEQLGPEQRNLRAFVTLATSLRERGIRAVFYVTPVDVETADRALGPRFRQQIGANVATVRRALAPTGAELIDLSFDVPASAFDYSEAPNEHLKPEGRIQVAGRLTEIVGAPRPTLFTQRAGSR